MDLDDQPSSDTRQESNISATPTAPNVLKPPKAVESPIAQETTVDKSLSPDEITSAPEEKSPDNNPVKKPSLVKKIQSVGISSNLDQLVNSIKEDDKIKKSQGIEWSLESVQNIWNKYGEGVDSKSMEMALTYSKIFIINDVTLQIKVPNKINLETLKAEMPLIEMIRDAFPDKNLVFDFKEDPDAFPNYEIVEVKKSLSPHEKLAKLTKKNPLIEDLIKKMDLRIEK